MWNGSTPKRLALLLSVTAIAFAASGSDWSGTEARTALDGARGGVTIVPEQGVRAAPAPGLASARRAVATDEGALLLSAMNDVRARAGLGALEPSDELDRVARARALDLSGGEYFAHVGPDVQSAASMVFAEGIALRQAAENLVRAYPGRSPIRLLMDSPRHRANILDPAFDVVGIGAYPTGEHSFVIAAVFGDSY